MNELIERVLSANSSVFRNSKEIARRLKITPKEADELKLNLLKPHREGEIEDEVRGGSFVTLGEVKKALEADRFKYDLKSATIKANNKTGFSYILTLQPNSSIMDEEMVLGMVAEMMSDIKPRRIVKPKEQNDQIALVCIADAHAGSKPTRELRKPYTAQDFYLRLEKLSDYIIEQGITADKMVIVTAGDQMDGYNGFTTRGGHHLGSMTNIEQVTIFVKGMKFLLSRLAEAGVANSIELLSIENSNHSGGGFSQMATMILEEWASFAYPDIVIESRQEFVFHKEYGNHAVIFSHGKDDKFCKKPLPLTFNSNTMSFLYKFIVEWGISNKWIQMIKADLHQFAITPAPFGDYISLPSFAGGNDYSDHNFSGTEAMAIIRILKPNDRICQTYQVPFE